MLTELYRSYDSENKYMVLGSIVHRLLQLCLKSGDSKISQIESNVHELVKMKDIVIISACLYIRSNIAMFSFR